MAADLAQIAKQNGIKYFHISCVDLFGSLRAKRVPTQAIKDMQPTAHPDRFARPDANSLIQLPWDQEICWLASDLWMDGR